MSHLHIPDGVLPGWLVLTGWILTAIILALCIYRLKREEIAKKIPLIGIISALMIVCMTLPVIPFAYHINLSIVAGIVLGPAVAFIAIFIVDLVIAMFGHGGITVVGLNTIVIGAEAVIGYYIFRGLLILLGKDSPGWSAGIATVLSLIVSTSLLIGLLYASQLNPEIIMKSETAEVLDSDIGNGGQFSDLHVINLENFICAAVLLLAVGWTIEGVLSGLVIKYISGVRPDLIPVGKT